MPLTFLLKKYTESIQTAAATFIFCRILFVKSLGFNAKFLKTFSPSPRARLNHLSFQPCLTPFSGHMPAYSLLNMRADKPCTQHMRTESTPPAIKAQNKVQ